MNQQERDEEIVDAINRTHAAVVRLEDAIVSFNKQIAAYIVELQKMIEIMRRPRRPWWRFW